MSKVSRSSRKRKDEDNSSKQRKIVGKEKDIVGVKGSTTSGSMTDSPGLRRSARNSDKGEKHAMPTPTKKPSERVEKSAAQSTPMSTRKSERVDKQALHSPTSSKKKSDKGATQGMPSSSNKGMKQGICSSSDTKMKKPVKGEKQAALDMREKKKGEGDKQSAVDSRETKKGEKHEQKVVTPTSNGSGLNSAPRPKRLLDARSYRAAFSAKPKAKAAKEPDLGDSPKKQEKCSRGDSDNESADGCERRHRNEFVDDDGVVEEGLSGGESAGNGDSDMRSVDSKGTDVGRDERGERRGDKKMKPKGKYLEGNASGLAKNPKGVKRKKQKTLSIRFKKKRKLQHVDAHLPKYSHRSPESNPEDIDSKCGSQNEELRSPDDGIKTNIEEVQLCRSSKKARAGSMGGAEGAQMEKDSRMGPGSITKNGLEVEYQAKENCQALEMIESNSPEGRPTPKRKRKSMDPDVDISDMVGKDTSNLDTSTADTTASSPSGGKSNKSSERLEIHNNDSNYRCVSCFKQKRVDNDLQNQVICSCNAKTSDDLCEISFSEGVCEQAASLKSAQRDENVVRCLQDEKAKEKLDLDARAGQNVHAIGDSHTIKNVVIRLKQDRVRLQVNANIGIAEECGSTTKLKETTMANLTNREHNTCAVCKLGGKLLCCDGKGCTRTCHLSCLNPPLNDVPPGIWHCLWCVKKKLESGVQSVSEGVESIWDFREVEISEGKPTQGTLKEKQYFVKYQGLAHVHNCWVPESHLLVEAPTLVTKFNRRYQKEKVIKWKSEWTIPQRLLQRRLLMSPEQADEYFGGPTNIPRCKYEWFVKWKGLGYEHCTWELENSTFLKSSEGILLINDYESRRTKAKKASDPSGEDKERGAFSNLRRLPDGIPPGIDGDHLRSVNKLRESWHKCQNAVVIDDQERTTRVILFILSLQCQISRPFLIISTSAAISVWESEFIRLAPTVNVVVYGGNRDVRETIRSLEFFEDGGNVMFEVLLSIPDAVVEDVDTLECLGWEAIIIDECQRSRVSKHIPQILSLSTDFRLLLLSDQIKDNIAEYLNLLSFLDSEGDGKCNGVLKNDVSESVALTKLKERLGQYIAYEHKSDSSKFIEYWVPVHFSKVQVEQYCTILSSNYSSLRSNLKNDRVGALRDVLISTRKCCDHPYLVDDSLQSLLTKGLPEIEFLNVGVNACGKLQLLDKILPEIRKRGLRVLIIFQLIGGSKPYYIGDILDDYLRQRFGADSYERIDSGLITSKKQAALNMFNNKERGRFVFLIEHRACLASIKLSSVDTVILFDSDWNPLNDLRALQKINIDYQFEQLKIFRLYSPYTVEEKVLVLAKQDPIGESNLLNMSSSISHALLIWGSAYLFSKLDEFRDCNGSSESTEISHEQPTLNDVAHELLNLLFHEPEVSNTNNSTNVLRVQQSGTTYCKTVSLVGESEMQLTDEEPPHIFWTKLLEGRFPGCTYSAGLFQRPRRKVQYFEGTSKPENDSGEAKKKHKKMFTSVDPVSLSPGLQDKKKVFAKDKEARVANSDRPPCSSDGSSFVSPKKSHIDLGNMTKDAGAAFGAHVDDQSACLPCFPTAANHPNHGSKMPSMENHILEESGVQMAESEGRKRFRNAQQSLHLMLKPELLKLCTALRVPEEVKSMAVNFLGYIMGNHQVPSEPETILQAFQISLCWTAASFLKQKMDHKESLALAKQCLNFECKEEEAESVYSKLRLLWPFLKNKFWCRMGTSNSSGKSGSQESYVASQPAPVMRSEPPTAPDPQEIEEGERADYLQGCHSVERSPVSLEQNPQSRLLKEERTQKKKSAGSNRIKRIMEQQKEFREFNKLKEAEKAKLKKSHKLERGLISTMYNNLLVREQKLKELDEIFAKKRNNLDELMNGYQKKLAAMQLDARNWEKQGQACWSGDGGQKLTKSFSELPLPESEFGPECSGNREINITANDLENRVSRASLEQQNADVNVPEVSPGVPATAQNPMEESIPIRTVPESTAEANMPVGAIPESSAEQNIYAGVITESPAEVNMPGRTVLESGTLEGAIVTEGEAEQHSGGDSSTGTGGSISQQQSQSRLSSFPQSHTDLCLHHSLLSPQVPSVEDIQPSVSLGIRGEQTPGSEGQGSLQHTEVPIQQSVDSIPSHAEQLNHNTPLSLHLTQLQLPSYTDMHLEPTPVVDSRSGSSQLESGNRPSQNFVSTSQTPPLVHPDPLHNELVRLRREEDQAIKMHEEEKIRLKAECERELEEVQRKYSALLQDSEMGLEQRRMALEMNINKVLMNRILAEAIKLQLHDPKAPHPGTFATFTQFVSQPMLPSGQRPMHPSIPAPPPAPAPAPPLQGVPHSSTARFSGNSVTPRFGPPLPGHGNFQAGEPRTMGLLGPLGPHANHGRPVAPISVPLLLPSGLPNLSSLHPMPPSTGATRPSYLVALSGSRPLPPPLPPPGSSMLPAFANPSSSLSPLGLLLDLDNCQDIMFGVHGASPAVPGVMPNLPALQESEATFNVRVLPELQPDSGHLNGASVCTAASVDVVCLSDDD